MLKRSLTSLVLLLSAGIAFAQNFTVIGNDTIDYANPKEYILAPVRLEGAPNHDNKLLLSITGLQDGSKVRVPGDDISKAITTLWKLGEFDDVQILIDKIQGNIIFLTIRVEEKPLFSKLRPTGMTKHEIDDIREKIHVVKNGTILTESKLANTRTIVREYFTDKGYPDAQIDLWTEPDTMTKENDAILNLKVSVGPKVRIGEINFVGNSLFSDGKLWRTMKETKRKRWWNPFNTGKLIEEDYEKDKQKIVEKYKDKGLRDARIVKDSIYRISKTRYGITIFIEEGHKYYFRNITWVGNSKHSSVELSRQLGIKRGDVYNQSTLESRLFMNATNTDVSSLYMDDGYLFFNVQPVEVLVEGDSIDLEMRIVEGKQATINKVTVVGNTKTNDRVIMRELRTKPGQLFRRSDIIRSQRQLALLGYFDPEKMQVNPIPNAANGTVDIEYVVEEKPSDQLELSGGFGAGRVIGTLGVSFNNFSARNMFKKGAWAPLPSGDGQRLSVRAQSNGLYYQSYNFSFTEPWLGGKKPHSLTFSFYQSVISNGVKKRIETADGTKVNNPSRSAINISNFSLGFGSQLKKPDDYFSFYGEANYQYYVLNHYTNFVFTNGYANNFNLRAVVSRNSVDQPLTDYPTSGSNLTFTVQGTPPYSFFNGKDYSTATEQEKYKWIEYYKFKFTTSWFKQLAGKDRKHALVLNTRLGYGILGAYNPAVGTSPFERFYLGGSGLTGFYAFDGREIIALRGYSDNSVYSGSTVKNNGASAIAKYTLEFRYPISLNPQALVYGLAFAEGGNSWEKIKDFNPFSVKRSVGVGFRIFLPMFGLLGLDYGWRLDDVYPPTMQRGQFHFTIGMNLGEL